MADSVRTVLVAVIAGFAVLILTHAPVIGALARLFGIETGLHGAGRTDAGEGR